MAVIDPSTKSQVVMAAGLHLTAQASCPIAAGNAGFWRDSNNTVFWRDLNAVDHEITGQADGGADSFKGAVRLVDTANLAGTYLAGVLTVTATSALTIDSVAAAVGDRVLLAGQSTATQNGIYVVTAIGGSGAHAVLTRADDASESAQFVPGFLVGVGAGTVNVNTFWVFTVVGAFTLDTTNATFAKSPQFGSVVITDPGASGAIPVTASGVCDLVTAGAETRTVAAPSFVGQTLLLNADTIVTSCTVAFAANFDNTPHAHWEATAAGQSGYFIAATIAGVKTWRLVANNGGTLST